MKRRDTIDLLMLAMLWGGSFPFMRVAVREFGPVPLIEMRVTIAALVLTPSVFFIARWESITEKMVPFLILGVLNAALPFTLLAYATLSVTAGFAAILNATTPLFGSLVAVVWLKERLTWPCLAGLAIGFCGVICLVYGKASLKPGGSGFSIIAALIATCSYGVGANYAKRNLEGVPPLAAAAGSQIAASLVLSPLAICFWPSKVPSAHAWAAAAALGVGCTAVAFFLFYRLIAHVGATKAITVTFLIPVFTMIFGWEFLDEKVTLQMLAACGIILLGTGLATGLMRLPARIPRSYR